MEILDYIRSGSYINGDMEKEWTTIAKLKKQLKDNDIYLKNRLQEIQSLLVERIQKKRISLVNLNDPDEIRKLEQLLK